MNFQTLLQPLGHVVDFLKWKQQFAPIEGFLQDLEGYALLLLAGQGPGVGEVVELGSYLGRSTAFLAAGSKMAHREKVTAIDHFRGSREHQPGQSHESAVLREQGTTLSQFRQNLQRAGLADYVNPVVASSAEAVRGWNRPVRLLFIDADHSYAASRSDFELWSPFIVPGGVVCFHDVTVWPGVTQFYTELMKATTAYREVASVWSLKVIQRLPGPAQGQAPP